ncbi:hypothetical protein [Hoeflea sp. 108]|uniref:hypothetical protein n=1 Tax=Hoeflea sp. 108 TaxID=1116369 RepID=UPI001FDAC069|nr:hypothetical protein [Hoeflea sp. 108]
MDARKAFEQRRFAGAIFTEQGMYAPGGSAHRDTVERRDPAEPLFQSLDFQHAAAS